MATYTVEALVLRRRDLGESDRIVTLYTREKGKISTVARGTRKPGSKLASLTEGLSVSRMSLAVGKTFDIITQVQPIRAFVRLRSSLERLSYALYWCELLDKLVQEGETNEELFTLTETLFSALETTENPEAALRWGEFQLMAILGYEPIVDVCARCEGPPTGLWAGFSPSVGGILCARCGVQTRDSVRVPLVTVPVVRQLLQSPVPGESLEQREGIAKITRALWRHLLERDLKSATFIDELLTNRK